MTEIACRNCGTSGAPRLTWQTCRNQRRHIRANCAKCGSFLRYVEQTARNCMAAEEPPVAQRDLFAGME
jgi:hypothetical protein